MSATEATRWAASKRSKLETYAKGEVGEWAAKARDVCLPGVPVAAIVGFMANGGRNENTTGWKVGDQRERDEWTVKGRFPLKDRDPRDRKVYGHIGSDDLHELGPGGVEGGHCPTPVATDPECPWVTLAASEEVRKVLGRPGVTGKDWYDAIPDQVVIGVANLARHLRAVRRRLPPPLQWAEGKPVTGWQYALAMMTWSAGGLAASHVTAYAVELAGLREVERWGRFLVLAGAVDDPRSKHRADEYSANRTEQKRAAGALALAFTREGDARFFDDGLDDAARARARARLAEVSRDND